jgi:hypothetical protein
MLVRGRNAERFNEGLVRLGRELENLARRNLTDQAVHAERLYLRLLNRLYGWELRSESAIPGLPFSCSSVPLQSVPYIVTIPTPIYHSRARSRHESGEKDGRPQGAR